VRLTLWGTRGSMPAMGPETARYGGNTACVEVRGSDGTLLVLDAGTGIRRLAGSLDDNQLTRVDILLSHLHLDHIQGLGVFAPLYQPGLEVHIWGPPSTTMDLKSRLGRYLSPPLFPVRIRDLPCDLTLHDAPREAFLIGGLVVKADMVCHPGPTLGYRISEGEVSVAYVPDHEPALGAHRFPEEAQWTSGFDLMSGADVLIHDAQYSETEYMDHVGWGHSSMQQAVALAAFAGVKRLMAFHHDPAHDDEMLDRLIDQARMTAGSYVQVALAAEGTTFDPSD
jgi:phosphoribosyl 1,2-cyclic phosphodiesterase